MNVLPTQITTTWAANGKTSQVKNTYDSGFAFSDPSGSGTNYSGLYGKVITQKEYDYGTTSGQPGPLLKQTNTSYAWQSPNPHYSNYLSNNMMNLVFSSQITDGSTQMAYSQYGYDETATVASGLGTAQNLDTAVWTGLYRGNQTSVNRWRNLPTVKTITSTTTNYDTGMPSVAKDPLLNPTTYSYSSTFQGAYLTQVKNALNRSTYHDYDYNTGLLISTTDPNGQVTTDSYASDWRLTLKTPFNTMALVSVCLGLRVSELLALKWRDVDWLSAKLNIERGIVKQIVDDVKTDSSRKFLAVDKELLELLRVWKQTTQFSAEEDWIFASPVKLGRLPYSYTGFWRELERASKEAGIGHLGTHAFRHTYRSWLDAVGTPIAVQQKLMRHSDIRTTMNIYGDVVTDEMGQAHSKVVGLALSRPA